MAARVPPEDADPYPTDVPLHHPFFGDGSVASTDSLADYDTHNSKWEQAATLALFSLDDHQQEGRKLNPGVVKFIRNNWIAKQLQAREEEFCESKLLRLFVGTWNVNGKARTDDIAPWLFHNIRLQNVLPDIYVVGFQEIVELSAPNMIGSTAEKRTMQWAQDILNMLNVAEPKDRFKMVEVRNLVGIAMCVFIKFKMLPHVTEVMGSSLGVGVFGVMGNKGAVGVRMRIFDSSVCFVCGHLSAHQDNVAGRNADFTNIVTKFEFKKDDLGDPFSVGPGPVYSLLDHDMVFWLGDLNYRINLPYADTMTLAKRARPEDVETLFDKDQLNQERRSGRCFAGFSEGDVLFPPTYRYQQGTDVYDERPGGKVRAPAWCDRILWRSDIHESAVKQLYYGRTEQKMSDHKPVHSLFELNPRVVVKEKRYEVFEDIMHRLQEFDTDSAPRISLSTPVVNFGNAYYKSKKTESIRITNIGQVCAVFRFVPKLEERVFCRPWLKVDPPFGFLLPEEYADVFFEVDVGVATARDLSFGRETLNDTLVLRLENGQDFFISVSANPIPTAFGASIAQLAGRPEPIRSSMHVMDDGMGDHLGAGEGEEEAAPPAPPVTTTAVSIPKEIWRLVDALSGTMDTPGLFQENGVDAEEAVIRDCIDSGAEFDPSFNPLSFAAVLVELVTSFREPIIPTVYFPTEDVKAAGVPVWCSTTLSRLSPMHYNTLLFLIMFIKEVVKHSVVNGLTEEVAARLFGPVIMRRVPHEEAPFHGEPNLFAGVSDVPPAPVAVADEGTGWTPTEAEEEAMAAVVLHLLRLPKLE